MPHILRSLPPARILGRVLACLAVSTLPFMPIASHAEAPAASAESVPLPAGVQKVTTVEGINEYRLDNGLRILLAPDQSKPTTTVNVTYLVGSRHENYGETGMAHLLEHMLFRGTPTTRNALGEFSRRGLRANGSTWTDRTNYFASFAANDENLEWYLGWQADAMVNSLILREDLDSEMTVVRNEMENGENSPSRVLMSRMLSTAYLWHNYGNSTIGARSDVENVSIQRLRDFYHLYYQPDNAELIVSGRFDEAKTLAMAAKAFGKIPKPTRTLPPLYTVEPVQDGERSVIVRRSGGAPLLSALYHTEQGAAQSAAAMNILASILGDTPSGRLYRGMVDARLAASVYGYTLDMYDPGVVIFGARLQPGASVDTARSKMYSILESIKAHPITQEELDRARTRWLNDWLLEYSDPQRVGVSLSESIAIGDWRLFFAMRDRVRALKLADVQRAAENFLLQANRTGGTYVPTEAPVRAPEPAPLNIAADLKDYQGDPKFSQAEAFDATPANIDARTQVSTLDLPNGPVQLALLPKDTRGQMVRAQLTLQFGNAESLRGLRAVSSATAALLSNGTSTLTRQQLDDRFDALQANVGFGGGGTNVSVDMSTTHVNLPATIALVFDVLRNANFPADQLDTYQRAALAGLANARQDPPSVARMALSRHDNPYPPDDLRYSPDFNEQEIAFKALTRDALVDFHKHFYGAGRVRLAVVGDFDPEAVKQAVTAGLKGWQRAPAFTRVPDPFHPVPAQRFQVELPDRANAFFVSTLPLKVQDTDPDYPALMLANHLLGSSETSRLWTRVREQEGLSYNVRSTMSVSSHEPTGDWTIFAIFAPTTRERVEAAVREESDRVLRDGFTEQEVRDGIQSLMNMRRLTRAQDGRLVETWSIFLDLGRSFAFSGDLDAKLQSLTADQVNAAMRRHFKPDGFSTAVAGTFGKP